MIRTTIITLAIVGLVGLVSGKPADEKVETDTVADKLEKIIVVAAVEEENELRKPEHSDKEGFSRFFLTQVATMMCYRTWEKNPAIDFHECNVCFNETHQPESTLPKNDHITRVESCFSKYLKGTDFKECLPMLRDPTIPNKPYDILVSEPPFDFSFKNFAKCAHGTVFKQEGQKCVQPTDTIQGLEPFLEKFSCLLKNLIVESRRFSEANLDELLLSVPTTNGTTNQ